MRNLKKKKAKTEVQSKLAMSPKKKSVTEDFMDEQELLEKEKEKEEVKGSKNSS